MRIIIIAALLLLPACAQRRINAPLPPGRAFDTAALVYGLRPEMFPIDTVHVNCWTGQDQQDIECVYVVEGDAKMEFRRLRVKR